MIKFTKQFMNTVTICDSLDLGGGIFFLSDFFSLIYLVLIDAGSGGQPVVGVEY